jgi:hypothetical protein
MTTTYTIKHNNINLPLNTTNGTITSASYSNTWTTATGSTNFGGINNAVLTIPNGENKVILEKSATLDVKGNVKINGIDLEERLKTIEKVLMIPERDATMETKYPSLKKKYDEYINALGKYRTFEAIKGE